MFCLMQSNLPAADDKDGRRSLVCIENGRSVGIRTPDPLIKSQC